MTDKFTIAMFVLSVTTFSGFYGCSSETLPQKSSEDTIHSEYQTEEISGTQVGNSVGDQAPDFRVLLANGEVISYSTLRHDRMPVFLFFFSRY